MFRMCVAVVCASVLSACGPDIGYYPPPETTQGVLEGITGRWRGEYTISVENGPTITRMVETIVEQEGERATVLRLCPLGEGSVSAKYTGSEVVRFAGVVCGFPANETDDTTRGFLVLQSGSVSFGPSPTGTVSGKVGIFSAVGWYALPGEVVRPATIEYMPIRGY